ncbi:UDP-glucose/GDP-mannose dehydrogenase family protein [Paenibacillaceae bacterium]|nr:UDP-glucose/GDP-mannose dehydrogenase family protein [Paenibacillaceae bacterium]
MRITIIGTGYVGLVSGVCFADLGHQVIGVDTNEEKIAGLQRGQVPIYEPKLAPMLARQLAKGRISFTTKLAEAMQNTDIVVLAVGTPSLPSGEADLRYIEQAGREIALAIVRPIIVMTKSTVPVGTNDNLKLMMGSLTTVPFDIVSVPEFLREGSAVRDTLHPERIVIGADRPEAAAAIAELHRPLTENIIITDIRSAEMIKYASNAYLATKISFINEIANICEKVGADVSNVAKGMGFDKRIGKSFLKAGIGYGGSCFPKDTQALIQIAGHVEYEFKLLKSVVEVNRGQRFGIIDKLEAIFGQLDGLTIAIWGLAFKPETDDVRDAPSYDIIMSLIERGAVVQAYDPIALDNFRLLLDSPMMVGCGDALSAVNGADALCLLTEWKEFTTYRLSELEKRMKQPVVIDGRNVYEAEEVQASRFVYRSVGRPGMDQGIAAVTPQLRR